MSTEWVGIIYALMVQVLGFRRSDVGCRTVELEYQGFVPSKFGGSHVTKLHPMKTET